MIHVGDRALSLNDFSEILFKGKAVVLDAGAVEQVDTNYSFLKKFSANKLIYGINTGFGPMAQYKVSEENCYSFSTILFAATAQEEGTSCQPVLVKAVMVARLNSLIQHIPA
jgi:histidine ammonia-lyase